MCVILLYKSPVHRSIDTHTQTHTCSIRKKHTIFCCCVFLSFASCLCCLLERCVVMSGPRQKGRGCNANMGIVEADEPWCGWMRSLQPRQINKKKNDKHISFAMSVDDKKIFHARVKLAIVKKKSFPTSHTHTHSLNRKSVHFIFCCSHSDVGTTHNNTEKERKKKKTSPRIELERIFRAALLIYSGRAIFVLLLILMYLYSQRVSISLCSSCSCAVYIFGWFVTERL